MKAGGCTDRKAGGHMPNGLRTLLSGALTSPSTHANCPVKGLYRKRAAIKRPPASQAGCRGFEPRLPLLRTDRLSAGPSQAVWRQPGAGGESKGAVFLWTQERPTKACLPGVVKACLDAQAKACPHPIALRLSPQLHEGGTQPCHRNVREHPHP